MPTYEYQCKKCQHLFDVFQSMSDEPLKECPECKGEVKRLIGSGSGMIFKGSGFYETDYKRKSAGTTKSNDPCSACEKKASGACDAKGSN
jgi:putative FmdB family regulatory protein